MKRRENPVELCQSAGQDESVLDGRSSLKIVPESSVDFYTMIGRSPAMLRVYERLQRFARAPLPVLVLGETGAGKELVAQAIHEIVGRQKPFVAVNCAALSEGLVDSELFGHERGAFTSATRKHRGLLAQAHGGILFLDEIPALSLETQAKLLRAVETGGYRAVGGEEPLRSQFRLIAATNRDLGALAARGEFRLDLYYRLGPAAIILPPLRERLEDLPALADAFLRAFQHEHASVTARRITKRALELLMLWDWPGNVRELRNVVERGAVLCRGPRLGPEELAPFLQPLCTEPEMGGRVRPLAEVEGSARVAEIRRALIRVAGRREEAAALLGISVPTLKRRLRESRSHSPNGSELILGGPAEDQF